MTLRDGGLPTWPGSSTLLERKNPPWKRVHITWKRMGWKDYSSISYLGWPLFWEEVYDMTLCTLYQDHISLHLHTPRPEVMTGASTGRTSDRDVQVEIAWKPQECCWFRWKVKGCRPLKLDQAFLKVFWGALRILTPSYWKPSKHQTLLVTPIGPQKPGVFGHRMTFEGFSGWCASMGKHSIFSTLNRLATPQGSRRRHWESQDLKN